MPVVHLALVRDSPGVAASTDAAGRLAVAAALDIAPDTVHLGRRCPRCGGRDHGAPVVRGGHASVSLARAPGVAVAAAVRGDGGVGIDVERAGTPVDGLRGVALRPDEPAGDDGAVLRAWVRKEAVLKAAGTGLATDPREVRLDGPTVVEGPAGPWWIEDVPVPGLVISVAVRGATTARVVPVSAPLSEAPAAPGGRATPP